MEKNNVKSFPKRFFAFWLTMIIAFVQGQIDVFAALNDDTGIGIINTMYCSDLITEKEFTIKYMSGDTDITAEVADKISIGSTTPDSAGKFVLAKNEKAELSISDLEAQLEIYDITSIEITPSGGDGLYIYNSSSGTIKYDITSAIIEGDIQEETTETSVEEETDAAPEETEAASEEETEAAPEEETDAASEEETEAAHEEETDAASEEETEAAPEEETDAASEEETEAEPEEEDDGPEIMLENTPEILADEPESSGSTAKHIDKTKFTLTEIISSDLKDVTLTKKWKDDRTDRPDAESLAFTIFAGENTYSEFFGEEQPGYTHDTIDENTDEYTFSLPAYNQDGNEIEYSFEEDMTDISDLYRSEKTDNSTITNISLTEFECSVKWADSYDAGARPESLSAYAALYREYLNDSGETECERISFDESETEYEGSDGNYTFKIKGLDRFGSDGTVNTYYAVFGDPADGTFPVSEYAADSSDYYRAEYVNEGINSAQTGKCYNKSSVLLILSNKVDFEGTVIWDDAENKETRQNAGENAGSLVLYRSAGDSAMSAQVSEEALKTDSDTYDVKTEDLDKYDRNGDIYTYYAKEKLDLAGYKKLYADKDGNEADVLFNAGTITNTVLGEVEFKVNTEWISAACQNGEAEVSYTLQKKVHGSEDWENVQTISTGKYTGANSFLSGMFEAVNIHDENGEVIEYRVVQSSLERSDVNASGNSLSDVYSEIISAGEDKTEFEINGNKYRIDVTAPADISTYEYTFKYTLVEKEVQIVKKWDDGADLHIGDSVTVDLLQYNNDLDDYEKLGSYELSVSDISFDGREWAETVSVPVYDSEGRQLKYKISETDCTAEGYSPVYSAGSEDGKIPERFTVENISGAGKSIELVKVWNDGGDEENRVPVSVNINGEKSAVLSDSDGWIKEVSVTAEEYQNLSADSFSESIGENTVKEISGDSWIDDMAADADPDSERSMDFREYNNVAFEDISGIIENKGNSYAVQQKFSEGRYTVTNTRIGVLNAEIQFDWNVGSLVDDGTINLFELNVLQNGVKYGETVTINDPGNPEGLCIANLPKYDAAGVAFNYSIEAVKINSSTVEDGICVIGEDTFRVSLSGNTDKNEPVVITVSNDPSDTTELTVYEKWIDDSNTLGLRTDSYISLWRYTDADETAEAVEKDYIRQEVDENNYKYIYENLEKYDRSGYGYIYFVTKSKEDPEGYTVVYLDESGSMKSGEKRAYNGETICNIIDGTVTIEGTKNWKGIPSDFASEDYPAVYINLMMKNKDGEAPVQALDKNGDPITTKITDGNNTYRFKNVPRYDVNGALIEYTVEETPVNGYTSSVSEFEVENTYTGGERITLDVESAWEDMPEGMPYPTVTVKLYQKYRAKNGTIKTLNVYSHVLSASDYWEYTFGKTEKLYKYAPNGEEFIYELTEQFSSPDRTKIELADGEAGHGFKAEINLSGSIFSVKNTYLTDDTFKNILRINKTWNNMGYDDYDDRNFEFVLYRKSASDMDKMSVGELDTASISDPVSVKIGNDDVEAEIETDPDGNRNVILNGLPIYAPDSSKYTYYVKEIKKAAYKELNEKNTKLSDESGTAAEVSFENVIDTFDITLTKKFTDSDGNTVSLDAYDPEHEYRNSVHFNLSRTCRHDDVESVEGQFKTIDFSELSGAYTYTFKNLPKTDKDGNEYVYDIIEYFSDENGVSLDMWGDGRPEIIGENNTGIKGKSGNADAVIINQFKSKKIKVDINWDDDLNGEYNPDGIRPDDVNVSLNLYYGGSNGEISYSIGEQKITNSENWHKAIAVPMYCYREGISYEWNRFNAEEVSIPKGYVLKSAEYEKDTDSFVIVNESVVERINGSASIDKLWEDYDNVWDTRYTAAYVKIQRSTDKKFWEDVIQDYKGDVIGENGVIKLDNANGFHAQREYLPYCLTKDATAASNGTVYKYYYRFVECDKSGITMSGKTEAYTPSPSPEVNLTLSEDSKSASAEFSITNTLNTIDVTMKKVWSDENNAYDTRDDYTVQLQQKTDSSDSWINIGSAVTLGQDISEYVFENLPVRDKNNEAYNYRVSEQKIGDGGVTGDKSADYSVTYTYKDPDMKYMSLVDSTVTITNELISTDSVTANKVWDDRNNQDGLRNDVTFALKQYIGSKEVNSFEKNASFAGGWSVVWENPPMYSPDGDEYSYKVEETVCPDGYTTAAPEISEDGNIYTFTNTHIPETVDISVEKKWIGDTFSSDDNQGYERPESVELTLCCKYGNYNGTVSNSNIIGLFADDYELIRSVDSAEDWKTVFTELPKYFNPNPNTNNRQEIVYYVRESALGISYMVSYSNIDEYGNISIPENNIISVENTLRKTSYSVEKEWSDDDNSAGMRPESIEVVLQRKTDDTEWTDVEKAVLSGGATAEKWSMAFNNLLKYDNSGDELKYRVVEASSPEGYELKSEDYYDDKTVVVNEFIVTETSFTTEATTDVTTTVKTTAVTGKTTSDKETETGTTSDKPDVTTVRSTTVTDDVTTSGETTAKPTTSTTIQVTVITVHTSATTTEAKTVTSRTTTTVSGTTVTATKPVTSTVTTTVKKITTAVNTGTVTVKTTKVTEKETTTSVSHKVTTTVSSSVTSVSSSETVLTVSETTVSSTKETAADTGGGTGTAAKTGTVTKLTSTMGTVTTAKNPTTNKVTTYTRGTSVTVDVPPDKNGGVLADADLHSTTVVYIDSSGSTVSTTIISEGESKDENEKKRNKSGNSPKTGDAGIGVFLFGALFSIFAMILTFRKRKKQSKFFKKL